MSRQKIPSMAVKKVFQETGSCCAFCDEADVAALEIHHMDEDSGNNAIENLLLVCSSCHSKITHGAISPADVHLQKRIIQFQAKAEADHAPAPQQSVNVSDSHNTGIIANVVNIKGKTPAKMNYPGDSIGANVIMKGYIDYLYGRYIEFRKADKSFGAYAHAKRFHPGELHRTIQSKFKAKTFFIHAGRFDELVGYIQGRIDSTILGRRNRGKGVRNYDTYAAYRKEQLGSG